MKIIHDDYMIGIVGGVPAPVSPVAKIVAAVKTTVGIVLGFALKILKIGAPTAPTTGGIPGQSA